MRIVLIGAGRLAFHLGHALYSAGHDIVQVYSRTMESARQVTGVSGGVPISDVEEINYDADVYIVALKDSVVADLIPCICKGRERKVFLHTAGSLPMDIFRGIALHYGVFYPLQSFTKEREVDFWSIPCFIEANDEYTTDVVRALSSDISCNVRELSSEDRKHVHLAAVFACNFVNHCYALSADILAMHGISFDMMLPLIDETARKVHAMSPVEAQTGPALRYDENVIRNQSMLLSDNPLIKELYDRMSMSIHRKAISR